ncbi:MAG: 50S ribosomal protein L9 [Actinomycetota bacterium]|nr:50S ribosomal protein L9 [Actinomycetota bacterium]
MQVILQAEVPSLGREGDIIKVAGGYANNYLIPKGLAVLATPGNLKQLELRRTVIVKREAIVRGEAEAHAAKLEGKSVTITAKAGAEGRLYGSITTKDMAAAIEDGLGVAVDRRRIEPSDPIKQAGDVTVKIKFYPGVEASVVIKVISDMAEAAVADPEMVRAETIEEPEEAGVGKAAGEGEADVAEEADKDEA